MGCAASTASAIETMQAKAGDTKHAAQRTLLQRNERKQDEKLIGISIDPKMVEHKERLRAFRNAVDAAAEAYRHWSSHTTDGLLLPSLSVLARRADADVPAGGGNAATKVQYASAHCAALTKLQMQSRAQFGKLAQAEFHAALREAKAGLDEILEYEKAAIAAKALEDDSLKPKPKATTTAETIAAANEKVATLRSSASERAATAAAAVETRVAEAFRLLVAGYEKPVDGARTMLDDESIGELFKAYQPKYATTTAAGAIGSIGLSSNAATKSKTDEGQEVNRAIVWAQESVKNCTIAKAQLNTFAQKGLHTLFGPRNEDEVLDALKAAFGGAAAKGAPKPAAAFADACATFTKQKLLPTTNALDAYISALEGGVILAGKEYNMAVKNLTVAQSGKGNEDISALEGVVTQKAAAFKQALSDVDVAAALVRPIEAFIEAFVKLMQTRGSTGVYAAYKAECMSRLGREEEDCAVQLEAVEAAAAA